jgi:hypothetical protein
MEVFLLPNELPLVQAQMPDAYWRCMSETRDKRRRTDLDLFVLAQRLVEAGFVRQGKPGARGRTDHTITSAGGGN